MLTQEAAIQQIHDAKSMVENDLQKKLEEFEEEREQLLKAANKSAALERELEEVHTHTHTRGPCTGVRVWCERFISVLFPSCPGERVSVPEGGSALGLPA